MVETNASDFPFDRDPKQLDLLAGDLEDLASTRWSRIDPPMIPPEIFRTYVNAAGLVAKAIRSGELILARPVLEALGVAREDLGVEQEDNEGYLNRIAELQRQHQVDVDELKDQKQTSTWLSELYMGAFALLERAAFEAVDKLGGIEVTGQGNPIVDVVSGLSGAIDKAQGLIPKPETAEPGIPGVTEPAV
jgi:hypothetical protein